MRIKPKNTKVNCNNITQKCKFSALIISDIYICYNPQYASYDILKTPYFVLYSAPILQSLSKLTGFKTKNSYQSISLDYFVNMEGLNFEIEVKETPQWVEVIEIDNGNQDEPPIKVMVNKDT